jgi:hypothetical protein
MKGSLKVAALVVCSFGLGACASTDDSMSYTEPTRVGPPDPIVTDRAYVDAVEREARRRGIYVQWVNMPRKRIAQE